MTFEELKRKADELKTQRDQALGAIKGIEDNWEQKYGTRDVNELTRKMAAMQEELEGLESDIKERMAEAERLLEGAK